MREVKLSKTGINKIRSQLLELKTNDLEDSIKSFFPGEWAFLHVGNDLYVGFVNPTIDEKYPTVHVLKKIEKNERTTFQPLTFLKEKIVKAFEKRMIFKGYFEGSRIFYGMQDGLPGLIVDLFQNYCLIQINTAGLDQYRDEIFNFYKHITKKECVLLDDKKYREKENLPTFQIPSIPKLEVIENNLRYQLDGEVIQKIGFYYDHRENRKSLRKILGELNLKFEKGVDLFCYAGAWGMNALAAGVSHVEFVDQGDFSLTINENLKINCFEDRGSFSRDNVFHYLDQCIQQGKYFDLILCDPPAFTKTSSQKKDALDGYVRLHRKVFKVAQSGALCCFSSCTQYVDHEEFVESVLEAAKKESKTLQLIYTGIQGWDHPISSLNEKSSYIKSYYYLVE